jgi:hypothetical protein
MNDNPENGYWITEYTTYKIFANSEDEARVIWNKYWCDGEEIATLDIKVKDGGVDADWVWEREAK